MNYEKEEIEYYNDFLEYQKNKFYDLFEFEGGEPVKSKDIKDFEIYDIEKKPKGNIWKFIIRLKLNGKKHFWIMESQSFESWFLWKMRDEKIKKILS